jgi:hypothetical protein
MFFVLLGFTHIVGSQGPKWPPEPASAIITFLKPGGSGMGVPLFCWVTQETAVQMMKQQRKQTSEGGITIHKN